MKILKLRNLLGLLAIGGLLTFTACSDDDNGNPAPSLSFTGGEQFIDPGDDAVLEPGDTARFSWTATNGGSDLDRLEVRYTPPQGNQTVIFDSQNLADNNATEYADQFAVILDENGEHEFLFEIVEGDGDRVSETITVTVEGNTPLESYTAVMVGAQNNTDFGSFYSVERDSVFFATGFNSSNGELIDFIYYYGSTNDASIASPTDNTVEELSSYSVTDFNQRNETVFLPIQDGPGNFNNASDLDQFRSGLNSSSQTLANQLSTSDNFAFQLENGKVGVFGVQNLNNMGSGTITINVKVEP